MTEEKREPLKCRPMREDDAHAWAESITRRFRELQLYRAQQLQDAIASALIEATNGRGERPHEARELVAAGFGGES